MSNSHAVEYTYRDQRWLIDNSDLHTVQNIDVLWCSLHERNRAMCFAALIKSKVTVIETFQCRAQLVRREIFILGSVEIEFLQWRVRHSFHIVQLLHLSVRLFNKQLFILQTLSNRLTSNQRSSSDSPGTISFSIAAGDCPHPMSETDLVSPSF